MSTTKAQLLAAQATLDTLIAGLPADPVVVIPPTITPSADKTSVPDMASSITDKAGVKYTIGGGQVYENNVLDSVTNNVDRLYYVNSTLYQHNTFGQWYAKISSGWTYTANDPTATSTPVVTPPSTGTAGTFAGTNALGYTGTLGTPVLATDFKTSLTSDWYGNRDPNNAGVDGPFNPALEQACFNASQLAFDGDRLWISTAQNKSGKHPECAMVSGCITTMKMLWGENTYLEVAQTLMPGNLNWQSIGGYGVDGYPEECDFYELTGGMLMLNKHYKDSSGNSQQVGQVNWGPSNPADGVEHILGLEWTPTKLVTYFDGHPANAYNIPEDKAKYSLTINNAVRNGSNPTIGRTLGVNWVKLSPITKAA